MAFEGASAGMRLEELGGHPATEQLWWPLGVLRWGYLGCSAGCSGYKPNMMCEPCPISLMKPSVTATLSKSTKAFAN